LIGILECWSLPANAPCHCECDHAPRHSEDVVSRNDFQAALDDNFNPIAATIVTINRPVTAAGAAGPGIKRSASFTITKDNAGGMTGPVITGTKPFPLG
jgi:hypothetical protein